MCKSHVADKQQEYDECGEEPRSRGDELLEKRGRDGRGQRGWSLREVGPESRQSGECA